MAPKGTSRPKLLRSNRITRSADVVLQRPGGKDGTEVDPIELIGDDDAPVLQAAADVMQTRKVDVSFLEDLDLPRWELHSGSVSYKVIPTPRAGSCLFACSALHRLPSSDLCDWIRAPRSLHGLASNIERAEIERVISAVEAG